MLTAISPVAVAAAHQTDDRQERPEIAVDAGPICWLAHTDDPLEGVMVAATSRKESDAAQKSAVGQLTEPPELSLGVEGGSEVQLGVVVNAFSEVSKRPVPSSATQSVAEGHCSALMESGETCVTRHEPVNIFAAVAVST